MTNTESTSNYIREKATHLTQQAMKLDPRDKQVAHLLDQADALRKAADVLEAING